MRSSRVISSEKLKTKFDKIFVTLLYSFDTITHQEPKSFKYRFAYDDYTSIHDISRSYSVSNRSELEILRLILFSVASHHTPEIATRYTLPQLHPRIELVQNVSYTSYIHCEGVVYRILGPEITLQSRSIALSITTLIIAIFTTVPPVLLDSTYYLNLYHSFGA